MANRLTKQCLRAGVGLAVLGWACGGQAADVAVPKELPVEAQTPSQPIDFTAGVRLQSDYNFRGVSQSNHQPSFQTYFETQLFDNFLYGGFATYRTDLPTRPPIEFDITGGIRPKLGPLVFDLGFIYYNYPHERQLTDPTGAPLSLRNTDFIEFAGKVSYTYADVLTFGANVFHAGDYLGTHSPGTYASGTVKYLLPEGLFGVLPTGFALSGEFGHYGFGTTRSVALGNVRLPDYFYGNVGLSYTYKAATLDVRFHDTDLNKRQCFTLTGDPGSIFRGSGTSNWCGSAVVATLSVDLTASQITGVFGATPVAAPK